MHYIHRILTLIRKSRRRVFSWGTLNTIAVFVALCAYLYELPISAVVALQDNFHMGVSTGFIRYRLLFTLFAIAVCSLNLLVNKREVMKSYFFWLYVAFVLYMTLIVLIHHDMWGYSSDADVEQTAALELFQPILFKYVGFFLIGIHIVDAVRWRWILLLVLTPAMLSVFPYVSLDALGLDKTRFAEDASTGNYQFIGDAIAISSLIIVAWYRNPWFRWSYAVFTAVVLFLIGSRTSFILYVVAFLAYAILLFRARWVPVLLVGVLGVSIFLKSLDYRDLVSRNPRMVAIFTEYDEDNSIQERRQQSELGWQHILESPLLGNFGGQLDYGPPGTKRTWRSYMHDVFSYWRQFGVFTMIVFFGYVYRFGWLLFLHLPDRARRSYAIVLLPGLFLMAESLLSRSFAFSVSHLFYGLALTMIVAHATNRKFANGSSRAKRRRSTGTGLAAAITGNRSTTGEEQLVHSRIGKSGRRRRRRRHLRF